MKVAEKQISNPAIKRMLRALSRISHTEDELADYQNLAHTILMDRYKHQLRIRKWLKASGVASRIPAGLEGFPDIYQALPGGLRPLYRIFRPRTYEQLIVHIAFNLDWYMDPSKKSVGIRMDLSPIFVPVFITLIILTSGLFLWWDFIVVKETTMLVVAFFAAMWWIFSASGPKHIRQALHYLPKIFAPRDVQLNAGELYQYLLDTYSEQDANFG